MIFNKKNIFFLIYALTVTVNAQTNSSATEKKHAFTIYGGLGPNIYFNNLVLAKDDVKEINYSFAARFMWEPEYLLSLGFETGYIRLYTVSPKEAPGVDISNYAIPLHIIVSMKFLKRFYFNFGSGQTILLNKVSSETETNNASSVSLGDFTGTLGYRKKFENRLSIGVETKFFFASKLDDKNMAFLFMVGYSL
jgi:hypothetical protein